MGRPKKELHLLHARKIKKAKAKVSAHLKGEIPYDKLTSRAKKMLSKRKKTEKKPA